MKLIGLVAVLLVGLVFPSTGLRCYECVSEKGFEDTAYHKDCKEGDLPSNLGVDCDIYSLRNPKTLKRLTPVEIELKENQIRQIGWNITYLCWKSQGKFIGKEITAKGCDVVYWNQPVDEPKDRCESGYNGDGWTDATECGCLSNLCNGSGKLDYL